MKSKEVFTWQVIGGPGPGNFNPLVPGKDADGKRRNFRGGDVFQATEEEVRPWRHLVLLYAVPTPYVEPRDTSTAHVEDQAEAQRRRKARKLDRAMKAPPESTVI